VHSIKLLCEVCLRRCCCLQANGMNWNTRTYHEYLYNSRDFCNQWCLPTASRHCLAVSDHVRYVISSGAQALCALRALHSRGICDQALQPSTIPSFLYMSSAWWGFIMATGRQRVDGFIRRSKQCGFGPPDIRMYEEQCQESDQKLFDEIKINETRLL
jgi:hypothetical protein